MIMMTKIMIQWIWR